ncbi:DNA-damage repair protein [Gracilibacillus halophilus YIM-C55.5]|uniref:DNA-damage repair protein n=1 Tax=Gracilibacillus halophilus YIM-C55.5 TaxID=1308866 RepID=N4WA13_9BACI|nr:DNA polymerase IV [Gracilibacillus halophilus]ENH97123.1 DNA-damage repair protein [Gracilibacillus halophilus YIM-C55.5]
MDYHLLPRHQILCIDMRSFYASVECVKHGLNPMRDMLAVVGDKRRSGSIILAASPALKRKHGVKNVSRYFELPYDPDIYVVEAKMGDYVNVSIEITKLLYQYVPKEAIHPYSVDEMWITVDGLEKLYGGAYQMATMLQEELYETMGLHCAIGIGDNKFLAKVVMDLYAKKQGITACHYEDVERLLWPIPIEKVWGIGQRLTHHLNRMGILNLGQLAHFSLDRLKKRFGVIGEQLYWHAWGVDLSPVYDQFVKEEQKGFGHGITLLRDYSAEETRTCILDLTEEVCRRARTHQKAGRTIHLSIGYANNKGGFHRSRSIDLPTNMTMHMYHICLQLFHTFYDGHSPIRRVSVSLDNLYDDKETQLDLFDDQEKKKDLGYAMDAIREKYGSTAILRATSYTEAGITRERSKKIGGHYA